MKIPNKQNLIGVNNHTGKIASAIMSKKKTVEIIVLFFNNTTMYPSLQTKAHENTNTTHNNERWYLKPYKLTLRASIPFVLGWWLKLPKITLESVLVFVSSCYVSGNSVKKRVKKNCTAMSKLSV